jgi:hypothetical protein
MASSYQTTTNLPPGYAVPYHQQALSGAAGIADTPYNPYPYAQIAGFTPGQVSGMADTTQRGMQGSAVGNAAQADATKTLQGQYLDPSNNSALSGAIDYGQNQIMKNYGGQLGRNFGNSGVNQEVGESAGRLSSGLYDQERNRMMQTQQNAPNLANMDYTDLQARLGVGDVQQAHEQQKLNLGRNEWDQALNYPRQNLQTMLGAIQGTAGPYGTQTAPNPYQSNSAANALGGGLTGAALGSYVGNGSGGNYAGWGAGLGALGGLLM